MKRPPCKLVLGTLGSHPKCTPTWQTTLGEQLIGKHQQILLSRCGGTQQVQLSLLALVAHAAGVVAPTSLVSWKHSLDELEVAILDLLN